MENDAVPVRLSGDSKSLRTVLSLGDKTPMVSLQRETTLRQNDEQELPIRTTITPDGLQKTRLNVEILDAQASPGEYHGSIEIYEGERHPVVVQIPERSQLRIVPEILVFDDSGGTVVTKWVLFENTGNVPLTIGVWGMIPLGEEATLRTVRDERDRSALDTLADALRGDSEPTLIHKLVGDVEVRNVTGVTTLSPGENRLMGVEICLPEQVQPNRRYRARLPLYTVNLEIVLTPVQR